MSLQKFLTIIHRWGGLALASFIIFYCVTGILLNHRKSFDYFIEKDTTSYEVPKSDSALMKDFIEFYKKQIDREDDPAVIKIRGGNKIEFLYGFHGQTTYIIDPEAGVMEKIEKSPMRSLSFLNKLHKAFKTGTFWLLFSDIASILVLIITITGLVVLKYRAVDFIILLGGLVALGVGAMLA